MAIFGVKSMCSQWYTINNVVTVVKRKGYNFCQGDVGSSCVELNFYKCKIAFIAIKFLLFQAISNHKAWPGQDFQCDFAPVTLVIFSLCVNF